MSASPPHVVFVKHREAADVELVGDALGGWEGVKLGKLHKGGQQGETPLQQEHGTAQRPCRQARLGSRASAPPRRRRPAPSLGSPGMSGTWRESTVRIRFLHSRSVLRRK